MSDLYGLFNGHEVSEGVSRFSSAVGDLFVRRLADKERDRKVLSLSQIGRPLRQLYYDLTGGTPGQEKLSSQTKFKFAYGDLIEEMVLFLAMEAGHSVTDLQKTVSIDNVPGHIDCIIDDVLVDVKSCSSYSFNKFANGTLFDDDPFGYCYQLSSYWSTMPKISRAGFLAIDKVNGKLCFLELNASNKKTEAETKERIALIKETVAKGVEPPRCYEDKEDGKSGNRKLSIGCSYCQHRFHCWRDANNGTGLKAYMYSTGPVYLSHVAKEPRVQVYDKFPTKKREVQI